MHILNIFNLMFYKSNARDHDVINIKIMNISPVNHSTFFERLTLSYFNLKKPQIRNSLVIDHVYY